MKLKRIVEELRLEVKVGQDKLERQVTGGYASDIISDVMANARQGDIWVTFQTHENMVAVASLNGLAGVIVVKARMPEKEVIDKAEKEDVVILVSEESTFEVVGRLYELGIRGNVEGI